MVSEAAVEPVEKDALTSDEVDISMVSKWEAFFQGTEYMQNVREIADLYPDIRSIVVVYSDLDRFDADLAKYLLDHPDLAILAGKQALKNLMHQEMRKAEIALRFVQLPRDSRVNIRDLRGRHIGRLISFEALVPKVTQVKNDIQVGYFKCLRCGHVIKQVQEGQTYSEPLECYKEQEGCGRSANNTKFKLLTDETEIEDVQKILAQEPLENSAGASSPARITCWLMGDIAGTVSAGSRVIINGVPKMVREPGQPKTTVMDTDIDAVSVEVQGQGYGEIEITEEEEGVFRQMARHPDLFKNLIASFAPAIYGYDKEKSALVLQLFGGLPKVLEDGTRLRGDIHILLVGDPGVAKSVLVRQSVRMAPRGVFASGKSSSAAGLTCAAKQDTDWGKGNWVLEAGAMVLADLGHLGVDELDKMDEKDRSSMHEGMEQQSITANKAGMNVTLQCRCSISAAMNPKDGRFDPDRAPLQQLNIPDTLISRFDAIFMIQDRPNKDQDTNISAHVLAAHRRGGALANRGKEGMAEILDETEDITPIYDAELFRRYVAYARRINPVLQPEAMELIQQHYVAIRRTGEGDDKAIPITARQLEGYVRFAEASARSRLSEKVEADDARRAIDIVSYYLNLFAPVYNGVQDIDAAQGRPSKKSRDRKKVVREIFKTGGSDGLSISEACEDAAKDHGMTEDEVREIIGKMIREGDAMFVGPSSKEIVRVVT